MKEMRQKNITEFGEEYMIEGYTQATTSTQDQYYYWDLEGQDHHVLSTNHCGGLVLGKNINKIIIG
jgi:hypothetical protein